MPQIIWPMFSLILSKIQSVAHVEVFPTVVARTGADRDGWAWPGWGPGPGEGGEGGGGRAC